MSAPLVQVQSATVRYGADTALDAVSLDIPRGAFVVLLGPSGSGKTTLLNIIGGFLVPQNGSVSIGGQDVTAMPPARRPTTTVFQDYALFPHMTVGANVGFGLRMRGVPRAKRDVQAHAALAMVGLDAAFARKPHQLSGGQRQRVALARALVVEPLVLLLDEPLGALDLKLRRQMQDELKALQQRVGTTFVHVTHDQEEAMALADLLVVMNRGRIEDMGPPERVYARPATLFTAAFMGEVTSFAGRVASSGSAVETVLGTIAVPALGPAPGSSVIVAVRPEGLAIGSAGAGQVALGHLRVSEAVFQGQHKRVLGELGPADGSAIRAIVRVPAATSLAKGDVVPLHADAAQVLVFPADDSERR